MVSGRRGRGATAGGRIATVGRKKLAQIRDIVERGEERTPCNSGDMLFIALVPALLSLALLVAALRVRPGARAVARAREGQVRIRSRLDGTEMPHFVPR
jgi:hypothetical protein